MAKFTNFPILTDRFGLALSKANEWHIKQIRKGGMEAPYVSHLLAVASLVLEAGGNEDEAIAALLHDTLEDTEIEARTIEIAFGLKVLAIVASLSEDKTLPKTERKLIYAESMKSTSLSVVRVSLADKLHNIRCYKNNPELFTPAVKEFYSALLKAYGSREEIIENLALYVQLQEMQELYVQVGFGMSIKGLYPDL